LNTFLHLLLPLMCTQVPCKRCRQQLLPRRLLQSYLLKIKAGL